MSYGQNIASTEKHGVVKVGTGLTVIDGVVSNGSYPYSASYGFVASSITQLNTLANTVNIVNFDVLDPVKDITLTPLDDGIIIHDSGVYTISTNLSIKKTSGGTSTISIWLRKNNTNITGSTQNLALINTLSVISTLNSFALDLDVGDILQLCWSSADTTISLAALSATSNPIRPLGYSTKVIITKVS